MMHVCSNDPHDASQTLNSTAHKTPHVLLSESLSIALKLIKVTDISVLVDCALLSGYSEPA